MSAKPIIDILLECDDVFKIKFIEECLLKLHYDLLSGNVIPNYTFFTKKYFKDIGFHVHIMERGDPQIKRHIHFRDYLIHHPTQADEYAKLKTELAHQFVLSNDSNILDAYFDEVAKLMTHEDPQEYYVGYLNDTSITCGLICFYGRVAGLHCLTTSLRFRKKGYGTAMQMFRLKRAKELGYQPAVLQASDSGYALYLKLGWKPLGEFLEFKKNYV